MGTPELETVPVWFADYYKETFYIMVTIQHKRLSALQARMALDLHDRVIPMPYQQKLLDELSEPNMDTQAQEDLITHYIKAAVFGYTLESEN